MSSAAIILKLWTIVTSFGDEGTTYGDDPSASLWTGSEQLTYLLFLKMADEWTCEQAGKGFGNWAE